MMRPRTKKTTFSLENVKYNLTTVFLHVSFYAIIILILLLFFEFFS